MGTFIHAWHVDAKCSSYIIGCLKGLEDEFDRPPPASRQSRHPALNLRQIQRLNHTAIPCLQRLQRTGRTQLHLMRADCLGVYPVALMVAGDAETVFVEAAFAFKHFAGMGSWRLGMEQVEDAVPGDADFFPGVVGVALLQPWTELASLYTTDVMGEWGFFGVAGDVGDHFDRATGRQAQQADGDAGFAVGAVGLVRVGDQWLVDDDHWNRLIRRTSAD